MWNLYTIGTSLIDLKEPHNHKNTHKHKERAEINLIFIQHSLMVEFKAGYFTSNLCDYVNK